jgi:FMN phosphatase YigB (HAD superfamily)
MTKKVIALFDVDGTLTVPRKAITQEMHDFMQELQVFITFYSIESILSYKNCPLEKSNCRNRRRIRLQEDHRAARRLLRCFN